MTTEEIAQWVLRDWGFSSKLLPTSQKQSPDFLVTGENARYLIELKTKGDNLKELARRNRDLLEKGFFSKQESDRRTNTLSGIASDAVSQLRSSDESADYYLIWFIALDENSQQTADKFQSTVYGTLPVADFKERPLTICPCYFLTFSEFFRYREILDAALISYAEADSLCTRLCVNPYSSRYNSLKESQLYKLLPSGVVDPLEEELRGIAYVADMPYDRKDLNGIVTALQQKYSRPSLNLAIMSTFSTEVLRRIEEV